MSIKVEELVELVERRTDRSVLASKGGVRGVAQRLGTNVASGLTAEEAARARETFGENRLPDVPMHSFFMILWETLHDKTLIILTCSAIVSIILGVSVPCPKPPKVCDHPPSSGWIEGTAIIVTILIVALVTAVNDYSKELQFRKLNAKKEDRTATVIRNGAHTSISVYDLVVGDILLVNTGDVIIADGLVVEGAALRMNESSVTGESDLLRKSPNDDAVLLSGTEVSEGTGRMLVIAVGEHSQFGRLMLAMRKKKDATPAPAAASTDSSAAPGTPATTATGTTNSPAYRPKEVREAVEAANRTLEERKKQAELAAAAPAPIPGPSNASPASTSAVPAAVSVPAPMLQINTAPISDHLAASRPSVRVGPRGSVRGASGSVLETGSVRGGGDGGNTQAGATTAFQRRLSALAEMCGRVGVLLAFLLLIALILRLVITTAVRGNEFDSQFGSGIIRAVVTCISLIVVAIPEGLPLALTLSLAFSMMQMLKDNNLVRELSACEVMGGATAICSDKTGTLTQNKMTVVAGFLGGMNWRGNPAVTELKANVPEPVQEMYKIAVALNSMATEVTDDTGRSVLSGSPTEVALVQFARDLGADLTTLRGANPLLATFPFSSARKKMSVLLQKGECYVQYSKGASEIILGQSTHVITATGAPVMINEPVRQQLMQTIAGFADEGLRTIAVAVYNFPPNTQPPRDSTKDAAYVEIDGEFTLIGLVGIQDPVRPEVPAAVEQCQRAGIKVRMVTGDNIGTAKAIAKECGIYDPAKGLAMEGPAFRILTPEEMRSVLPRLDVLARSSPLDKQILVGALQDMGEVVAVTGDGTNDGPALAMADVGFSMGIAGTEVAKEASSIILMDDNFASIVKAVMWGRNVFDSMRKFLQFQLSATIVAELITIIGALAYEAADPPLGAVKLLWINLVMNTLAALALATEKPNPNVLKRKPYGRKIRVISNTMRKHMAAQVVYMLTVLLVIQFAAAPWFGVEEGGDKHGTIVFNAFVCMVYFFFIGSRRVYDERNLFEGVHKNPYFLIVMTVIAALQGLFVEFGGSFAHTESLAWYEWLITIGLGVGSLLLNILMRFVPTPFGEPERVRTIEADTVLLRRRVGVTSDPASVIGALHGGRILSTQFRAWNTLSDPSAATVPHGKKLNPTKAAQGYYKWTKGQHHHHHTHGHPHAGAAPLPSSPSESTLASPDSSKVQPFPNHNGFPSKAEIAMTAHAHGKNPALWHSDDESPSMSDDYSYSYSYSYSGSDEDAINKV